MQSNTKILPVRSSAFEKARATWAKRLPRVFIRRHPEASVEASGASTGSSEPKDTEGFEYPEPDESRAELEGRIRRNAGKATTPKTTRQMQQDLDDFHLGAEAVTRSAPHGKDRFNQAFLTVVLKFSSANKVAARRHDLIQFAAGLHQLFVADSDSSWNHGMWHVGHSLFRMLNLHNHLDEFLEAVQDRYREPVDVTNACALGFADVWSAFASGHFKATWPKWLQRAVSLLYKYAGLGVVAVVLGRALVPSAVIEWGKRWDISVPETGDMARLLEEGAKDLYRRCCLAFSTGSMSVLFEPWLGRPEHALVRATYLLGLPDDILPGSEPGASYYTSRLEVLGASFTSLKEELITASVRNPALASRMAVALAELQVRSARLLAVAAARKGRQQPFTLHIMGGAGIGKSGIVELARAVGAKTFGYDPETATWHYSPSVDYWDTFSPEVHRFCLVDDLGTMNPDKTVDPARQVDDLIRLANVVPMPLNADQIQNKGMLNFDADVIVVTSNHADMGLKALTGDHGKALNRRFRHNVRVELKDEFKEDKRTEIIMDLATADSQPWRFILYTGEVVGDQVVYRDLRTFQTDTEFAHWLHWEMQGHVSRGQRYMTATRARVKRVLEALPKPLHMRVRTSVVAPVLLPGGPAAATTRAAQIASDVASSNPDKPEDEKVDVDTVCLMTTSPVDGLLCEDTAWEEAVKRHPADFEIDTDWGWDVGGAIDWWDIPKLATCFAMVAWFPFLGIAGATTWVGSKACGTQGVADALAGLGIIPFLNMFTPQNAGVSRWIPIIALWPIGLLCGPLAVAWASFNMFQVVAARGCKPSFLAKASYWPVRIYAGVADRVLAMVGCSEERFLLAVWVYGKVGSLHQSVQESGLIELSALIVPAAVAAGAVMALRSMAQRRMERTEALHGTVVGEGTLPAPSSVARDNPVGWASEYKRRVGDAIAGGAVTLSELPNAKAGVDRARLEARTMIDPRVLTARPEDMELLVQRQTYNIVVVDADGIERGAQATLVTGSVALTSAHTFVGRPAPFKIRVVPRSTLESGLRSTVHSVSEGLGLHVEPTGGPDLALVVLPLPPGRDVTHLLPTDILAATWSAGTPLKWLRSGHGHPGFSTLQDGTLRRSPCRGRISSNSGTFAGAMYVCESDPLPINGDSGSPVLLPVGQRWVYAGVLHGERESEWYASAVTQDWVKRGLELARVGGLMFPPSLKAPEYLEISGVETLSSANWVWSACDGKPGCPLSALILGQVDGRTKFHPEGRIRETPFSGPIKAKLATMGAVYCAPPSGGTLVERMGRIVSIDTYSAEMEKVVRSEGWDPGLLSWAAADYFGPLGEAMKGQSKLARRYLTPEEAVFGAPELKIKPVALDKSAGPELGGVKCDWVDVKTRTLKPELRERVMELFEELRAVAGATPMSEVAAVLALWKQKLEMRKDKHADAWSTRHFLITDFSVYVVMRMIMGVWLELFHGCAEAIKECVIGINAMDPAQWGLIFGAIESMGGLHRLLAADISGFDLNQRGTVVQYIAYGVYECALEAGFSEEHARMCGLVFLWAIYSIHNIGGVILASIMKNPSGVLITGEGNSIYNSIECRYCFAARWRAEICTREMNQKLLWAAVQSCARLAEELCALIPPFRQCVALRVYGDDNVAGVSPRCTWFDRAKWTDEARKFGLLITSAQKDGRVQAFDKLTDITFLKRGIVPVDGFLRMAWAPLDLGSILRPGVYAVADELGAPGCVRDAMVLENMQREASAHPRVVFDEVCALLPEPGGEWPGYGRLLYKRFQYDDLRQQALRGELRTWEGGGQRPSVPSVSDTGFEVHISEALEADNPGYQEFEQSNACSSSAAGGELGTTSTESDAILGPTSTGVLGDGIIYKEAPPRPIPVGTGGASDRDDILTRPLTVYANADVGALAITSINILSLWTAINVVQRRLAGHAYLSGHLELMIQVQGNPRTAGLFKVGVVPCANASWIMTGQLNNTGPVMAQLFQMRGHLFDFSQADTVVLRVAASTIAGCVWLESNSLEPLTSVAGGPQLVFGTVKNATDVTLTTAPAIPFTVRARLVPGYQLSAATSTFYSTVTSSTGGEWRQGILSRPLTALSQVAGALAVIPALSPYAMATSVALGAGAKLAALMGYSAPVDIVSDVRVSQQPHGTMGHYLRNDAMAVGSFDPKAAVCVDSLVRGFDEEITTLHPIISRPGLLIGSAPGTFEFSTTATRGSVLWSVPVSPIAIDSAQTLYVSSGAVVPTPVGWVSRAATTWGGSLRFRLRVAATAFHRGRVAVYWVPTNESYGGTAALDTLQYLACQLDLEQEREVCFEVGASARHASLVTFGVGTTYSPNNGLASVYNAVTPPGYDNMVNGTLVCVCDAPLQGARSSTGVGMLLSVCAGEDFFLAGPSVFNVVASNACSSTVSTEEAAPPKEGRTLGAGSGPRCVQLVPGRSVAHDLKTSVGESWTSLRQALSVFQPVGVGAWQINSSSPLQVLLYVCPSFLWGPVASTTEAWGQRPLFPVTTTANTAGGGFPASGGTPVVHLTLLEYFRPGFVGLSGSTKHKIMPFTGVTTENASTWNWFFTAAVGWGIGTIGAGFATDGWFYADTNAIVPGGSAPGPWFGGNFADIANGHPVQVTVPWRSQYRFEPANASGTGTFINSTTFKTPCFYMERWGPSNTGTNVTDACQFHHFVATGEDFAFHEFVAAPVVANP